MTALKQYERLEAAGLWRETPDAKRRDVIVSVGDATLVITDSADRALAHWSLAAIARANPGERPAIFHPDGDSGETLELPADETAMIDAIEKLRTTIERRRPHPGRMRLASALLITGAVLALGVFWLPGAVLRHTVSVLPDATRAEIGSALSSRITRLTGQPCNGPRGEAALVKLAKRLSPDQPLILGVLRQATAGVTVLPGNRMLLDRDLVEDHEDPAVVAGFILAGLTEAAAHDPLASLLETAGPMSNFRLLTTGIMNEDTLDAYAETVLTSPPPAVPLSEMLTAFSRAGVSSAPYAYALDVSGETTLTLIEADPMRGREPEPVLADSEWIGLQAICGG